MKITKDDIQYIALGGAFLATGGGGDTLLGEIITEDIIAKNGSIEMMRLQDVEDDALIVSIGGVGSPTIMQEKPMNGREAEYALDALERYLNRKVTALIAFEAGGMNALVPFCAAAIRNIPVIDADGMGRAFPELQMESFSIYGVSATPLAVAGELGDSMIIENARSSEVAEKLVRHFAVAAGGGQCISAEHVMDGATARRVCIPDTISLCLEIGKTLSHHSNHIPEFISALKNLLAPTHYGDVRTLYTGKILDIERAIKDGYDFATLKISSFDKTQNQMTILIKNEYLLALIDDKPVTTTPDLICILDNETGRPITAETIRYGQRVTVIAIGAPALMRTPRALEVVSPRNFNFDYDYIPIEEMPEL